MKVWRSWLHCSLQQSEENICWDGPAIFASWAHSAEGSPSHSRTTGKCFRLVLQAMQSASPSLQVLSCASSSMITAYLLTWHPDSQCFETMKSFLVSSLGSNRTSWYWMRTVAVLSANPILVPHHLRGSRAKAYHPSCTWSKCLDQSGPAISLISLRLLASSKKVTTDGFVSSVLTWDSQAIKSSNPRRSSWLQWECWYYVLKKLCVNTLDLFFGCLIALSYEVTLCPSVLKSDGITNLLTSGDKIWGVCLYAILLACIHGPWPLCTVCSSPHTPCVDPTSQSTLH
jgi:hypothetical protein